MTDVLRRGVALQDQLRAATAALVNGLNPITAKKLLFDAAKELHQDVLNILVNLDDPLSAGNEFLKLNQKWNAAASLTYILTEKDPATGMKKALTAIHRQVKLAKAAGAGPNGKVAAALLTVAMNESKKFIDRLPDDTKREIQTKQAVALYAATFATIFKTDLSHTDYPNNLLTGRHPMYTAELKTVATKWLGNDHGSGGHYDFGMNHPIVEDKPGCISLGDIVYRRGEVSSAKVMCGVEDGRDDWWSRPIDYELLWGDNCSGGTHDLSVWKPVCKEGYVSVGFVGFGNSSLKPLPNQIACLRADPELLAVVNGEQANLEWIANDAGSGAKFDVTFFRRQFLGMNLMYALNQTVGPDNNAFRSSLHVPVDAPGTPPSGNKAHCVNFYSEPDFRGWTHQSCALDFNDPDTLLGRPNFQILRNSDGISSFQCGDEVAGVELLKPTGTSRVFDCKAGNNLGNYDNAANRSRTMSSYVDARTGHTVLSPKTIADNLAIAEQAEIERLQAIIDWNASLEQNQRLTDQCRVEELPGSCFLLGMNYSTGTQTLEQDYIEALDLLNLACELSDYAEWACLGSPPGGSSGLKNVAIAYGNLGFGLGYRCR